GGAVTINASPVLQLGSVQVQSGSIISGAFVPDVATTGSITSTAGGNSISAGSIAFVAGSGGIRGPVVATPIQTSAAILSANIQGAGVADVYINNTGSTTLLASTAGAGLSVFS